MFTRLYSSLMIFLGVAVGSAMAETVVPISFGNMNNWEVRLIPESGIIGGNTKTLYAIAPNDTVDGNIAYKNKGGSPWATCNILAHVKGITKGSNAVFPDSRGAGNRAAKLSTMIERVKVIGLINIDVLVGGSIFLGEMIEPITSTSNPYGNMVMGVPFTKRPKALQFDYKLLMPDSNERTYSSGFGRKKTLPGHDEAEVYIILQRRWEDANGNLYAKRVGTGRERYGKTTDGWVNGHRIEVKYGDITGQPGYKDYMGLIPEDKCYYARNSKGVMVPVHEVGWDSPDATPTHLMVMASAASGTAYIGTVGLTLWVDNFGLVY
ncbi:MAG: PCMD domain-containing protein [Muribaculaceae bacterium]|nr:PCMD domain-containing protein [Muribaculaceae bacterium]